MKLRKDTYNKKDGSTAHKYVVGKMNDRGEGMIVGDSVDIKVGDYDWMVSVRRGLKGPKGPFDVVSVFGAVISECETDIEYNDFGNIEFQLPGRFCNVIEKEVSPGNTIRFSFEEGQNKAKETITYFKLFKLDEAGNATELKVEQPSSSPAPKKELPPIGEIPKPVQEMHEEVAAMDKEAEEVLEMVNTEYPEWKAKLVAKEVTPTYVIQQIYTDYKGGEDVDKRFLDKLGGN